MYWTIKIFPAAPLFPFDIQLLYGVIYKDAFHWAALGSGNLKAHAYAFYPAKQEQKKFLCTTFTMDGGQFVALELDDFSRYTGPIASGTGKIPMGAALYIPAGPIKWTVQRKE